MALHGRSVLLMYATEGRPYKSDSVYSSYRRQENVCTSVYKYRLCPGVLACEEEDMSECFW